MAIPARPKTPIAGTVAVTPRPETAARPATPSAGVPAQPRPAPHAKTVAPSGAKVPAASNLKSLSDRASSSTMLTQVNLPGSTALPRVSGRQSDQPKGGRKSAVASAVRCTDCGCTLSQQSLAMGTAQRVDDKLVCVECIRQRARAERARATTAATFPVGKVLVATVLVFAAAGVVLPGQVLLLVCGAGILGLAAAAIGFTLSRVIRLALGVASLAAVGGSLYGINSLQEQSVQKRANAEFGRDVSEIRELLASDRFAEAQSHLRAFAAAATRPGSSEAVRASVRTLESELDQWLDRNFGSMNQQTRGALSRLLSQQPFKNASGSRRVRSVSIDDKTAKLVVAFDCKPADAADKRPGGSPLPADKDSLLDAANLGGGLFQYSSTLQSVEVQVLNANGDAAVGTFKIEAGDAAIFTGTPRIEEIMRLLK